MADVELALVWHHHQPYYRDRVTGRYAMPWVRLHGTKDYYGMARLLQEAGGAVRATVNLVPSLLEQIEDYAAGTATDRHLELSSKPAPDLDRGERAEALDLLFMAHWEHLVRKSPRYGELLDRRQPRRRSARYMVGEFDDADFRDLQVWANLSWFHRTLQEEDPEIARLVAKDRGFSEEEKAYLLDRQREVLGRLIPLHRDLAAEGILELTTSPYYHPILPLLLRMEDAREALPGTPLPARRTSLAVDARQQLAMAVAKHEALFGQAPRGLWPSEGSVSPAMLPLVKEAGFDWLATDQEVLAVSRMAEGYQQADLYRPWGLETEAGPLAILFRDHLLSDLVGFAYQGRDGEEAAADLVGRVMEIGRRIPHRPPLVTLILDGENPWEHYPDGGISFLRGLYRRLGEESRVRSVRISDRLAAAPPVGNLARLHSGSWIHANFAIWIGHPDDVRAWDYLFRVRGDLERLLDEHPERYPAEAVEEARRNLLIAEGSDWTWWYGDDHTSGIDEQFDALFRTHLGNVYRSLGLPAPRFLEIPVPRGGRQREETGPSALLHVRVDGRETSFFEWLGAGRYVAARGESLVGEGGAMHRAGRALLSEIWYGFDRERFFLRVDFAEDPAEDPAGDQADSEAPARLRLVLSAPREQAVEVPLPAGVGPVAVAGEGAIAARDEILELQVPFAALKLVAGDEVAFTVELRRGELLAERLPGAETLLFTVPGEDFEGTRWQA